MCLTQECQLTSMNTPPTNTWQSGRYWSTIWKKYSNCNSGSNNDNGGDCTRTTKCGSSWIHSAASQNEQAEVNTDRQCFFWHYIRHRVPNMQLGANVLWLNFMFCWPYILIYACNETNLMHYLSSVHSSHYTSKCFGLASSPSSGGNKVYMWQLVPVVHLSWLSAGLDGPPTVNWHVQHVATVTYIYIVTSCWWTTSKPDTCGGIVTE
jgi:hypothetical protein